MEFVDTANVQVGLRFCFDPQGPVYRVTALGSLPSARTGHVVYETVSFINETSNDVATNVDLDVLFDAMVVR